jgi:hypothetical protein
MDRTTGTAASWQCLSVAAASVRGDTQAAVLASDVQRRRHRDDGADRDQRGGCTGGNPSAYALVVAVSSSNTFLLSSGHPALMMVTSPGGYRGKDFLRVGLR